MADKQRANRAVSRRRFLRQGGLAMSVGALGASSAKEAWAQSPGQVVIASEYAFGDGLKRIRAAKKVVFAMSGSSIPPQYYRDPQSNQPAGYDVEVAKLIAKDLEVDPVSDVDTVPEPVVVDLDRCSLDSQHLTDERSESAHWAPELPTEHL